MHKRLWVILSILLLCLTPLSAAAQAVSPGAGPRGSSPDPKGAPDLPTAQIVVQFRDGSGLNADGTLMNAGGTNPPEQALEDLSARAGTQLGFARASHGQQAILTLPRPLPADQVEQIAARLRQDPAVLSAEPDLVAVPEMLPNDSLYAYQWNLQPLVTGFPVNYGIDAEHAWDITTGDPKLVIAVVDTGVRPDHPDLFGRLDAGYDFISDSSNDFYRANDGDGRDPDPSDPGDGVTVNDVNQGFCLTASDSTWHGTHVTGIIGAGGNDALGVAGVNWQSKLLPVRALGRCGGYVSDIMDGARWAAGLHVDGVPDNPTPARVVNLSLGAYGACPAYVQSAVDAINAAGAVVVAAAGNSATLADYTTPANCAGVISVGATGPNGYPAWYSNYGILNNSKVTISAPGGVEDPNRTGMLMILSTSNDGKQAPNLPNYSFMEGTSMSAPHVSGIVSLMLSTNPALTPAQVTQVLRYTATPFPASATCGVSRDCGAGIANAYQAVLMARNLTRVLSPTPFNPGRAGRFDAPVAMPVLVTSPAANVSIAIGGKPAAIQATTATTGGKTITILPPTQTGPGWYALQVTIDGLVINYLRTVWYDGDPLYFPTISR